VSSARGEAARAMELTKDKVSFQLQCWADLLDCRQAQLGHTLCGISWPKGKLQEQLQKQTKTQQQ